MPPLGTAPHRISPGVWVTRTGRPLTAAGARYWENFFRSGHTDGRGHLRTPSLMLAPPPMPKTPTVKPTATYHKPGFETIVAARAGDRRARQAIKNYGLHRRAVSQAEAQAEQMLDAQFGSAIPLARQAHKVVNPVAGSIIEALSPYTAGVEAIHQARKGQVGPAALAAMGIFPFGPGKGRQVAKGVKAGLEAEKTAKIGAKLPPVPEGHVRIYRGEGKTTALDPDEADFYGGSKGEWFTDTPEIAKEYAKRNKGQLYYADVPEDYARAFSRRRTSDAGETWTEYRFPLGKVGKTKKPIPLDPEQQVVSAARAAQGLRPEVAALQKEERAKRIEESERAFEEAGGGVAGHEAAMAALRGKLPTVQFNQLKNLNYADKSSLLDAVQYHPELRSWEKVALRKAIENATEGKVFRQHEIDLVNKAFGIKAAAEAEATIPLKAKTLRYLEDVWNIPRAVVASGEVSAVFRQGLMFMMLHPGAGAKLIGPMIHAFGSEAFYYRRLAALHADPDFERLVKAKTNFTELGHLATREEPFQSQLAEKLTGLGPLVGKPAGTGSFVRMSGRAYTLFLDEARLVAGKKMLREAEELGYGDSIDENIASTVNWLTGRGKLPGRMEDAAVLLNTIFFAPRLVKTRFDTLNPFFYFNGDPYTNKIKRKAAFRLVGTGMAILGLAKLAGAEVGDDPRSADFGKIKFGNKRIDLWGGNQQFAKLYAQLYTGVVISTTTGEKIKLTGGFKGSRWDVFERFLQSKFAPTPSLIKDWSKNTDFAGRPFSWKQAAVARVIPLLYQDAYDTWKDDHNLLATAGMAGIGAFGVGIQTYGPQPKKDPIDQLIDRHLKKSKGSVDVDKMIDDYLSR